VPGDNPVSGVYRGAEAYFVTMPGRMSPLDDWRFTVGAIEVNEGDNAALVAVHLTGSRRGKRIDMDGHHMVRLDDDGLVVEGWGFVQDQAALDEFFSA
jgi:SnoaL-like domain